MTNATYEGWANRATWNVYLWLNNEYALYKALQAFLRRQHDIVSEDVAKAYCADAFGPQTPDGENLSEVDWSEIADAMEEDRQEALRYP